MNTSLTKAAAGGVSAFGKDPVVAAFVSQLSYLIESWLVSRGFVIDQGESKIWGDELLNGNLGTYSTFFETKTPLQGDLMRLVCALKVTRRGTRLIAWMHLRKHYAFKPWCMNESEKIEIDYAELSGVYKMELIVQKLRDLLGVEHDVALLEHTKVDQLLEDLIENIHAYPLAKERHWEEADA